jgi:hypothetical protein
LQLERRVGVDRVAGLGLDLARSLSISAPTPCPGRQHGRVDADAALLDLLEHPRQRHLERVEQRRIAGPEASSCARR